MNANERPGGYLMPELAPPPAGVRPFIARRTTPPAINPNHIPRQDLTVLLMPRPADWCYRCNTPGHEGEYACWVPIRPVSTPDAVKAAAMAARASAAVPDALANWTPEHEALIVNVVSTLMDAVDSARAVRDHFAGRIVWTHIEDDL